jgi:hypothetical protein
VFSELTQNELYTRIYIFLQLHVSTHIFLRAAHTSFPFQYLVHTTFPSFRGTLRYRNTHMHPFNPQGTHWPILTRIVVTHPASRYPLSRPRRSSVVHAHRLFWAWSTMFHACMPKRHLERHPAYHPTLAMQVRLMWGRAVPYRTLSGVGSSLCG